MGPRHVPHPGCRGAFPYKNPLKEQRRVPSASGAGSGTRLVTRRRGHQRERANAACRPEEQVESWGCSRTRPFLWVRCVLLPLRRLLSCAVFFAEGQCCSRSVPRRERGARVVLQVSGFLFCFPWRFSNLLSDGKTPLWVPLLLACWQTFGALEGC